MKAGGVVVSLSDDEWAELKANTDAETRHEAVRAAVDCALATENAGDVAGFKNGGGEP